MCLYGSAAFKNRSCLGEKTCSGCVIPGQDASCSSACLMLSRRQSNRMFSKSNRYVDNVSLQGSLAFRCMYFCLETNQAMA